MADPGMGTVGPYPFRARQPYQTLAVVAVTVDGVNNPVVVADPGNILSRSVPPVYVANGYIRFTLRQRWARIKVRACMLEDVLLECDCTTIVASSAAANTVLVHGHVATVNAGGFTAGAHVMRLALILER